MEKIAAVYDSYDSVVRKFGRRNIELRIAELLSVAKTFLETMSLGAEKVKIDGMLLACAVMDYYSDIMRLESFHPVEKVNKYKIVAYEVYWWLRRKPIQLLSEATSDAVFINEKFAVSLIVALFHLDRGMQDEEAKNCITALEDSLFYYFKYRNYNAQDIEMILLAFKAAGVIMCNENQSK